MKTYRVTKHSQTKPRTWTSYGCEAWSLTLSEEHRQRVLENRVLRRIFGPKRDEVTGEWRKLHKKELNELYSSPNIVRVIKSRRTKWVGHVARMVVERHWGDPGVDGRIILRWIYRRWDVGFCTGSSWLRIGIGGRQL